MSELTPGTPIKTSHGNPITGKAEAEASLGFSGQSRQMSKLQVQ